MTVPRALPPPQSPLSWLSRSVLEGALETSRVSPRGRVIQPFHKDGSATLQRMLNAVQPKSYIPPHRHLDPPKAESWIVLRGSLAFFTFDEHGNIEECRKISANGDVFGVDLEPGVYHTFFALEPDTVVFEVKSGPYAADTDKSFPIWAPREGSDEALAYLLRLEAEFDQRSKTKSA